MGIDKLLRKNFYEEEIICDYKVTELRKRIWSRELEILVEFDRICKENDLKYYITYGTLLGAVRHKGFIPWDDDVDVEMFRPDYERAKAIMQSELKPPFCWQDMYTILEDPNVGDDVAVKLHPFAKIMNVETAAIELSDMPVSVKQGIYIDIFPLDDAKDDIGFSAEMLELQKEVYYTIFAENELKRQLSQEHPQTVIPYEDLWKLMEMPLIERFRMFENLAKTYAGKSTLVHNKFYEIKKSFPSFKREWYDEITTLPIEGIDFMAAGEYDKILRNIWPDYMTPVVYGGHDVSVFDPDRSYREYLKK
ncbi:MAG: LicD family protein [Lachnospiraceae bacterium]|nr:LicD family protein [Lachnospiraceae bacterium]